MEIIEATNADIPEIIEVLKASLGETSSQKTEDVWNFKHVNNPFGKSLVLIAKENNKIIGVRALMRWQWQNGSEIFSALRAVDTATLPDHRGKGVFKKLTLKAVEIAKTNGDNFIFNTPNSQSRPGYLKMGWEQVGKVGVELLPINPFGAKGAKIQQSRIIDISQINTLLKLHNKKSTQDGRLFTPKSLNFIKWRYLNNPLQDYIIHFDEEFFCALYIKKHKYFNELRISEGLYINNSGFKKINRYARKVARILGAHVVSVAKNDRNFSFYSYRGGLGPILTIRELDISRENLKLVFDFNNWRNSLGDLELF